jgi:hypothetical protein
VFNVSEIIQSQIPDAEGTIPAGVHEGGMKIAGNQAENQYILIALYSGVYMCAKQPVLINARSATATATARRLL